MDMKHRIFMIVFSLCAISYSVDARPKKDTIPLPSPVNRDNLENKKTH